MTNILSLANNVVTNSTLASLALVTLVSTNWVNIPGDWKREGGTNFLSQRLTVTTNVYVQEVTLCTNRTHYSTTESDPTNGPVRWVVSVPDNPPPLPGQFTKP